jgi:hypothetical protein
MFGEMKPGSPTDDGGTGQTRTGTTGGEQRDQHVKSINEAAAPPPPGDPRDREGGGVYLWVAKTKAIGLKGQYLESKAQC